MSKYELVIFDLDGVLTETSEKHYQAWSLLFKNRFNIILDPQLETKTKGVSRMDSIRVLLKAYDLLDRLDETVITEMANEKNTVYQDLIKDISCIALEKNKVYRIPKGIYHAHTLSKDAKLLIVEEENTCYENSPRIYLDETTKKTMINKFKEICREV